MKRFIMYLSLFVLCVAFSSASIAAASVADMKNVPIFMYHSLAGAGAETSVSADEFEADLRYLKENGYQAVTLSRLVDFVYHAAPLPENPVVLTFDDGYYNNLAVGLPLAQRYQMPIVVSVIGKDTEIWSENPAEHMRYGHLTWAQIQEMAQSGYAEIANHTWDLHKNENGRKGIRIRAGESSAQYRAILQEDVGKLQTKLQEHCGITPTAFVYPFGATCPEALEILQEMDFLLTLTCQDGENQIKAGEPACLYELNRCHRTAKRPVQIILEEMQF